MTVGSASVDARPCQVLAEVRLCSAPALSRRRVRREEDGSLSCSLRRLFSWLLSWLLSCPLPSSWRSSFLYAFRFWPCHAPERHAQRNVLQSQGTCKWSERRGGNSYHTRAACGMGQAVSPREVLQRLQPLGCMRSFAQRNRRR